MRSGCGVLVADVVGDSRGNCGGDRGKRGTCGSVAICAANCDGVAAGYSAAGGGGGDLEMVFTV